VGDTVFLVVGTVQDWDGSEGKAAGAGVVIILHAHSSLAGHAAALQTGNIFDEQFVKIFCSRFVG